MSGTAHETTPATASAASPDYGEAIATAEEVAAITFAAQPDTAALGRARFRDQRSWLAEREQDYGLIHLALTMLDLDDDGVAALAEQEPAAFIEFSECLRDRREFFEGISSLCGTTFARVMVGLARYDLAQLAAASPKRGRRRHVAKPPRRPKPKGSAPA